MLEARDRLEEKTENGLLYLVRKQSWTEAKILLNWLDRKKGKGG